MQKYKGMSREKADRIKQLYFTGNYRQADLASMYGVSQSTIARSISGQSWGRD